MAERVRLTLFETESMDAEILPSWGPACCAPTGKIPRAGGKAARIEKPPDFALRYITSNKRTEMLGLFGLGRSGGSGAGYQAGKSRCILDRDVRQDFAI